MASAALEAIGRQRLLMGIRIVRFYNISHKIGSWVEAVRNTIKLKAGREKPEFGEARQIGGRLLFHQLPETPRQVAEQEE
jgi:hypothetical protein